jgi:hypothetical protein
MDIGNWQRNTALATASLNGFGFEHEAVNICFEPRNGRFEASRIAGEIQAAAGRTETSSE